MRFGLFDHMDRSGEDMSDQYETRLQILEACDRAGFYSYHLAEHHGTPLGLAPSPSVFLAAAAQRTKTLRLGALVFTLSLYHPLRILDEICMLDHLSKGRLDVGIGRGISPIELGFYRCRSGRLAGDLPGGDGHPPEGLHLRCAQPSRQAFQLRQGADRAAALSEADAAALVRPRPARKPRLGCEPRHQHHRQRSGGDDAAGHRSLSRDLAGGRQERRHAADDGHEPSHDHRRHRRGGARTCAAGLQAMDRQSAAALAQEQHQADRELPREFRSGRCSGRLSGRLARHRARQAARASVRGRRELSAVPRGVRQSAEGGFAEDGRTGAPRDHADVRGEAGAAAE